jgi:hypothetical protein
MIHNHLQRALSLAKRTGDRLLVCDRYDERDSYVVMAMDEYERLIDMAENADDFYQEIDEMEEIEQGGEEDEDKEIDSEEDFYPDFREKNAEMSEISDFDFSDSIELDNTADYGRISDVSEKDAEPQKNTRKRWQIPTEVKQAGEEGLAEDDRYYLETI